MVGRCYADRMRRAETIITLTTGERGELETTVRSRTAPYRAVQRARLVLLAADGTPNTAIAREVGLTRARVVVWRKRFAAERSAGLNDGARPGKARKYTASTERRILAKLDEPPPEGYSTWTGRLVAEALGDVPAHYVWQVLRKHGIHLQRRRSWCVSTDPQFAQKAADVVALYLDPPENAVVLSVDEKPAIQALERELIDRHHRMVERRIKAARFPTTKSLDTFDFLSMPSLNKALVLELARCEYIERPHNVIALGNSGTGKTHIALGLGLAACQRGLSVGFTTAAALVHELIEARDERRLLNLQKKLARLKLLIIDELGFVPLSKTGAELLFEVFSQRYERGSVLVTSNLPFVEWTEVFGSERLTGALLDRLTHHVDILEMNGDSYRLKHSKKTSGRQLSD